MPEGPEVRRCADTIKDVIGGKKILAVRPVSGKLLRNGIKGPEVSGLVTDVYTVGKAIFIETDNGGPPDSDTGNYLVSTLGMSGWWYPSSSQLTPEQASLRAHYNNTEVETGKIISMAERHTRAEIICTDGTILNYVDMRNFGNLYVTDRNGMEKKMKGIGPDLLNDPPSENDWCQEWTKTKHAKKQIGAALLEQGVFSGLGNIYRAETCYLAGISPFATIGSLTPGELLRLLEAAIHVLEVAYKMGTAVNPTSTGYRLKMFKKLMPANRFDIVMHNIVSRLGKDIDVEAILERGYYGKLMVYGQKLSPINEPVERATLGGRTIWYVK